MDILKNTEKKINNPVSTMSDEYISKIKETEKLKSMFLQNLSHEIRTPLNAIIGFSELLSRENLEQDERKEFFKIVESAGSRILKTITDTLDLSSIETNQISVLVKKEDLNVLMENVFNHYNSMLKNTPKNLTLNMQSPDAPNLFFRTDQRILGRIISILIDNAIKYTEKGDVVIAYTVDKGEFFCSIKDTGIGIEENSLSIIYEKFQQVSSGSSKLYQGLGNGLSIAKGFVEILNGKIWVESQLKEGSTFYIKIPSANP